MTDIFARAEKGDEVNGRTCRVGEGKVKSDALQELLWDGEERGRVDEHGERRRGEGEGKNEETVGGASSIYGNERYLTIIARGPDSRDVDRHSFPPPTRFPPTALLRLPFPLTLRPLPGSPF